MKKIGLISLVLVLAMGIMGVGYAMWSDSLYLDGTVHTGDIGLEWSQGDPFDTEPADKDVSWGECYIDGETLYITIYNAYPSIDYIFPIDLHGLGSVPVHTGMTIVGGNIDYSWVTMPAWGGLQIHQSEMLFGDIVIHLDNTASENTTYTMQVQLDYWQYNEPPPSLPLVP